MATMEGFARELTPEEEQARGEECTAINDQIVAALTRLHDDWFELAHWCWEFNRREGWTALDCETQNEWLARPEITMRGTTFHRLCRRWQVLVEEKKIPVATLAEIAPSKLDIIMPAIEDPERTTPLEELLAQARELGARDLREEYPAPKKTAGKASEDPPEPDPDPDPNPPEEPDEELHPDVLESATVIDSYLEMSGDRRKAQRHWRRFRERHPVFEAAEALQQFFDPDPDGPDAASEPPSREEVHAVWLKLCRRLGIEFEYE